MLSRLPLAVFVLATLLIPPARADHNLSYLTDNDPWYPHHEFPKLITPQWVGEDGVDAVVVLAIDDMRDTAKYEAYLRPILQRLKQIDGRAPVSIMTCSVKPDDPRLQTWIDEGLSIEVHTIDHPCPLLAGERRGEGQGARGEDDSKSLDSRPSPLSRAKGTYDRCVDLLNRIPGNSPVAFRMPCCDSLNTVSPRFYSEIFNGTSPEGRHLAISSSVFNLFTKKDPTIFGGHVVDEDGTERFRKFIPKGLKRGGLDNSRFVNTIENYPYPFVISKLCWEFPCAVPSDWEAQFLQKPNNPKTVEDMKLALDLTVRKQGVFNLVFHPHGWIKSEQVVDLIDHAVTRHGKRVKFLTFREAHDRLNKNLLAGNPLRAEDGSDNGVRIVDVDRDGFMDVVIGNAETKKTRIWNSRDSTWSETGFFTHLMPRTIVPRHNLQAARREGQFLTTPGAACVSFVRIHLASELGVVGSKREIEARRFDDGEWITDKPLQNLFSQTLKFGDAQEDGHVVDVCFRQLNRHASSVALVTRAVYDDSDYRFTTSVWNWNAKPGEWEKLRAEIPASVAKELGDNLGRRIRFADLDDSGDADILLSDGETTRAWLMSWYATGKARPLRLPKETPPLVRAEGSDNGFFFRDGDLCWINESTDGLNDLTERISVADAVKTAERHKTLRNLRPALIGAAKMDITPTTPIRLAGYGGRLKESEGVADSLFARALVVGGHRKFIKNEYASKKTGEFMGSGQGSLLEPEMSIVVSVENCGIPDALTNRLCEEVARRFGVTRQRIAVCSTHSHSAPWLRQFSPLHISQVTPEQNQRLAQYEVKLLDKLVKVVTKAVESRRPGRLEWGTTNLDFAINRRRLDGGRWVGFGAVPDGPVDHRMPLLVARDLDGHLIGLLANYACHCTTLGGDFNRISGDWAGYASQYLEEEFQDHELPDAVALISIGAGADANPEPRGDIDVCQRHGRNCADAVLSLLKVQSSNGGDGESVVRHSVANGGAVTPRSGEPLSLTPLDPRIVCRMAYVDLPLGPLPSTEEWEARAKEGGARGKHAQHFLELTKLEKPLPTSVRDYPVQAWVFDDELAMVFLGGEVVVDYALRMSRDFDGERLWLNGYSNAMPCYIPSKRLLREGGYEVDSSMYYYAQPTRLAPEAEDIIVDTVQKLLPPRYYSKQLHTDFPPPTPYREAAATIHVKPGFKVELVAREPMVQDPVAFDWDPQGRLWVVQMGDYPGGLRDESGGSRGKSNSETHDLTLVPQPSSRRPQGGSVRVLEDTDGDGEYDQSTVFLSGLNHPTGIRCWKGGVLITAAPDIIFARDNNGNGQPDVREVIYTGFTEGNQQHRVNGLEWGLDNWLHVANGDSGGTIQAMMSVPMAEQLGGPPLNQPPPLEFSPDWALGRKFAISGRDLRIRPNIGAIETEAGQSQFGRCRDDWGNWFGCNNSNPMWHYVLSERYVRRNPHVPVGDLRQHTFEIPGASPVYPSSRTLARFNDFSRTNRFTSACSTTIYRDTLLGEDFYGNSFTCEPVHNLVSRRIVEPDGITFKARRADDEKESEFLASTDNWFRPVYARTGPDGALWIADMYRFVIEHPKWIPAEHQRRLDLKAGDTMGRIWRVVPYTSLAESGTPLRGVNLDTECRATLCCGDPDAPNGGETVTAPRREPGPPAQKPFSKKWNEIPAEELLAALGSANGWKRDRAQQLLMNRNAHKQADALWELATTAKEPLTRLHALCAVAELSLGNEEALVKLLDDPHPGVRRHAVRISEPFIKQSDVKITAAVLNLAEDADPQVQLQAAYSLGYSDSPAAGETLGRLAIQHESDSRFLTAILSSIQKTSAVSALRAVLETEGEGKPSPQLVAKFVGQVAAFGEIGAVTGELGRVFKSLGKTPSFERVRGLVAVMKEVRRSQKTWDRIWRDDLAERCARFGESRLVVARDAEAGLSDRLAALEFLAVTPAPPARLATKLAELLSPATPNEIQTVVVDAIVGSGRDQSATLLLSGWKSHSPRTRAAVTSKLLERAAWSKQLLLQIQNEEISPSEIDAAQRQVLLNSADDEVKQLAAAVFQSQENSSRVAIVDSFSAVRELQGDVARGAEVFRKRCGSCHQLGKIGKQLGADLGSLRDRSTGSLLTAILDPNRAVEARFLNYVAVTNAGKSYSGMLKAESATSITLSSADGKEITLLRKDLDTLLGSAKSFMPEGLEKDVSHQEMADVISFVQSSGSPWKRFDGNQPTTIRPGEGGSLTLPATAAAIHGPSLIFESKYKNLGFWSSEKDYAVWTLDLPSSGTYEVEVEYACENSTAGNPIRFSTGTRVLTANVPGTGTWDEYRRWKAGSIDLSRGSVQFVVSAAKRPKTHLIDLRSITLRQVP